MKRVFPEKDYRKLRVLLETGPGAFCSQREVTIKFTNFHREKLEKSS